MEQLLGILRQQQTEDLGSYAHEQQASEHYWRGGSPNQAVGVMKAGAAGAVSESQ
jgi:hypothetical protein